MKLTVLERLVLPGLLPTEQMNYELIREKRKFLEAMAIGEEEQKTVDLRVCSDWDTKGCPQCGGRDFEVETEPPIEEGKQKIITTRRTCKACDFRGAQGAEGNLVWRDRNEEVDVPIPDVIKKKIISKLKAMDASEPPQLEDRHASLYEKFVLNQQAELDVAIAEGTPLQ
uniref:Uncharacterized protein n=1 Tax=viral metagenome TaxID=1070528 RepID=A0A6M3IJH8_9ZZZZ